MIFHFRTNDRFAMADGAFAKRGAHTDWPRAVDCYACLRTKVWRHAAATIDTLEGSPKRATPPARPAKLRLIPGGRA